MELAIQLIGFALLALIAHLLTRRHERRYRGIEHPAGKERVGL